MKKQTWTLLSLSLFLSSFLSTLSYAETTKLTQAQYDQKMAEYTATVNSTKTVLDAKDSPATATEMKTAFCQRMAAYHQIAALSKANIELSTASVMLMVANHSSPQLHYWAGKYPGKLGWLMGPASWKTPFAWLPYALDNDAWGAFIDHHANRIGDLQ
jgi:hypothetical protein